MATPLKDDLDLLPIMIHSPVKDDLKFGGEGDAKSAQCNSEDELEGCDEEGLLKDLSKDIVRDFESLTSDISFSGNFSFHCSYPHAPNPIMDLNLIGTIGLPLGIRDVDALKASYQPGPPSGNDAHADIGSNDAVPDTLEIDSKEVCFRNPAWIPWLEKTVRDVCAALGVDSSARDPLCKFHKMFLCMEDSDFMPCADTEKTEGKFATVIVTLPSEFTGGATHLTHGILSTVYDCSPNTVSETTVMAWYTDVVREMKPITSGHRLALEFHLIHTAASPQPALPDQSALVESITHLLLSWKRRVDDVPEKIVYVLDHQYAQANSNREMKGRDTQIVAILDILAKRHGFCLGLASLVCRLTGVVSNASVHSNRDPRGDRNNDSEGPNEDMTEVSAVTLDLQNLVAFEGRMIKKPIFDSETEAVPKDLVKVIQAGQEERQIYGDSTGNGSRSLQRWYRRTALVIWPEWNNLDNVYGLSSCRRACEQLRTTTSLAPTPRDIELVEYVIRDASLQTREKLVMQSVCSAACTWKDFSIWMRAVDACDAQRSISALGEENIQSAVSTFGFSSLKAILENTLSNDPRNAARLRWLETFETWVIGRNSRELSKATTHWLSNQQAKILATLKKPAHGEYKYLVTFALRKGGLSFLEENILPQFKAVSEPVVLWEFAAYLHRTRAQFEPHGGCDGIIRDLLATAAGEIDFYGPTQPTKAPQVSPLYSEIRLSHAKRLVRACLATANDDLMDVVVEKLTSTPRVTAEILRIRAEEILIPLVISLADVACARPKDMPIPHLARLCKAAVRNYMESLPTTVTVADFASILQSLIVANQSCLVVSVIYPRVQPRARLQRRSNVNFFATSTSIKFDPDLARNFLEALHDKRKDLFPNGSKEVRAVIKKLAKDYATHMKLPTETETSASGYSLAESRRVIDAMDFCLRLRAVDACSVIITGMLCTPLSDTYITTFLITLIPELCQLAAKHRRAITSPPFAPAFRGIMSTWTDNILYPKDPASIITMIKLWTCNCETCESVRTFLTDPGWSTMQANTWHDIGAPKRKHVEDFLKQYAGKAARWSTVKASRQGLMVTKFNSFYKPVQWEEAQKVGARLLANISRDEEELKTILDTDYNKIKDRLKPPRRTPTTKRTSSAAGLDVSQPSKRMRDRFSFGEESEDDYHWV
ncbi:hypothetical protein B0H21DRAFT_758571 [Amylocystis lapponica]|nr:hypothetical protein B0H21DRAFT_758571 [Amylocystis lapponica]